MAPLIRHPLALESLHQRSRRNVLDALRSRGTASRSDLARITGLPRGSVSTLVAGLLEDGLVVERDGGERARQQGRPPILLTLHRSVGLVLGIDIARNEVHVALADLSRTVLGERIRRLDAGHLPADALRIAISLAIDVIDDVGADGDRILGVGLGLAGPIDRARGTVRAGRILPGWDDLRPVDELTARLGMPVHLDNDANLGALAEVTLGAGIGARNAVYLTVGATGIGGGLILDDEVYRGAGGTAGELGHLVVDEAGAICRCGRRGCLETVASGQAIVDLVRPTIGADLTLERVIALATADDAGAQQAIGDAGRAIGRALAAIVTAFNPELIIIGGPVSAAGDVLLDPIADAVRRSAIPAAAQDTRVTRGVLGARAEVLGAIELAARRSRVAAA